jgi:hypothetical protein
LFTVIGFPHAENVAHRCTPLCIPNYDDPTFKTPNADNSPFAVVLACVFDFNGDAFEDTHGVSEVETAFRQGLGSLRRVERYSQAVIVYTITSGINLGLATG